MRNGHSLHYVFYINPYHVTGLFPYKNTRKLLTCWCFQVVWKEVSGIKLVNALKTRIKTLKMFKNYIVNIILEIILSKITINLGLKIVL